MVHVMHEQLARTQQQQRLRDAERQRLAAYVVRVARARRAAQRADRAAERARLRLRLVLG